MEGHGSIRGSGLLTVGQPWEAAVFEGRDSLILTSPLIIDDLLGKEDTSLVRDIFIKGSHHNNISVIFVTQNLFLPHKDYRTLSLNAHYLVIFKNPRDMSQINALARQAFASKPTFLTAVYNRETSDRHSYLLLDFKQSTPELMRVRDSITTPWKTTVFVPTYK